MITQSPECSSHFEACHLDDLEHYNFKAMRCSVKQKVLLTNYTHLQSLVMVAHAFFLCLSTRRI